MRIINKSAWLHINDRKVLFVRSKGKDKFYSLGGKPEPGETKIEALVREVKEEVSVDLVHDSVTELFSFSAEAHGQTEPALVNITCFKAEYEGELTPSSEIEEMAWWNSNNMKAATEPGKFILNWLKEQDLID